MRTALQIVSEIGFAVGKTTSTMDSRIDLWAILNRAGRALYEQHRWSWSRGRSALLMAVADQNWLALPEDFGSAQRVTIADSGMTVAVVSTDDIDRLRQTPVSYLGGTAWAVAFSAADQTSGQTSPSQRLDIYPTPGTAADPTLTLRYDRTWRELSSGDPNRLPNIPDKAEQALVFKGRALVKATLDEDAGPDEANYAAECQRLIQNDVPFMNHGRVRGGADEYRPGSRGSAGFDVNTNSSPFLGSLPP